MRKNDDISNFLPLKIKEQIKKSAGANIASKLSENQEKENAEIKKVAIESTIKEVEFKKKSSNDIIKIQKA